MATAALTAFTNYYPSAITTLCGEVYCSWTYEEFLIHCTTCSQDFNLLSCNLFIKHIKECRSTKIPDAIENIFTPAEKDILDENADENFDPLLTVKIEISSPDFADKQTFENVDYQSDYKDEDDLTINKIIRRNMINDLINEYKKHPILWDANLSKSATYTDRALHYIQIAKEINSKSTTNFTATELRNQILRLRSVYLRTLKSKDQLEKSPQLWYFNKMHYIMGTYDDIKVETTLDKLDEKPDQVTCNEKVKGKQHLSPILSEALKSKERKLFQLSNEKIVEDIIGQYRKCPNLWNPNDPRYKDTVKRKRTLDKIASFINKKYNTNVTRKDICKKIYHLRAAHTRATKRLRKFNVPINLWYYSKLSFAYERNLENVECATRIESQEPKSSLEEIKAELEPRSKETETQDDSCDSNIDESFQVEQDDCKKINASIIQEYKNHPCLWDNDVYNLSSPSERCQANRAIKNAINMKFKKNFSETAIKSKFAQLRDSYRRALSSEEAGDIPLHYFDQISFIGTADCYKKEDSDNRMSMDSDDDFQEPKPTKPLKKRNKFETEKEVLAIIELYKSAPILWDTNHSSFALRKERTKTYESICSKLSAESDCILTTQELRNRIRNLKYSYFNFLRNHAAVKEGDVTPPKLFFCDQMSFLEPFANKEPAAAPKLHTKTKTYPKEDFTYLTENRPLMIKFLELYKEQLCLWDQRYITMGDPSAQSAAYDKIIIMFQQNDVTLTQEQVASAISFLQSTVVSTQKALEGDDPNKEPIWFYEHLKFLGRIPRFGEKFCSHCNQKFRTIREYEKHKIEIAGDFPYKCPICNAGFLTRTKFRYHQLKHMQPLKCDQCDFQAYDKQNFKVHMNRHEGVRAYHCATCDKRFVTSTELKRHLLMHTGERPFVCEICGKKMSASSEYNQHMKRHRNQRDHKCAVCGYAAYDPEGLRDHMVIHSSERNHSCDICGASFKKKSILRQHKTLHDKEKRHTCKICGKVFAQNAGLYSHMKSHGVVAEKI